MKVDYKKKRTLLPYWRLTKDNRPFRIAKEEDNQGEYLFCRLSVLDIDYKEIGFLSYSILGENAFLHNIEINNKSYLRQGVGYKMFAEFEAEARKKGCVSIKGKFKPHGAGQVYAKSFYIKNGFKFRTKTKSGEVMLYKSLILEQVKQNKSKVVFKKEDEIEKCLNIKVKNLSGYKGAVIKQVSNSEWQNFKNFKSSENERLNF